MHLLVAKLADVSRYPRLSLDHGSKSVSLRPGHLAQVFSPSEPGALLIIVRFAAAFRIVCILIRVLFILLD